MTLPPDEKDRHILFELDTDATAGLKHIAKKLRMSKEAVSYRIRQLEKKHIIANYYTLTNFSKLGLTHYKLYIKYSRITERKKREIIAFLAKNPNLGWLASTEGSFDLMVAIRFPSLFDFERFKDDLFRRYDKVFQRNSFAILTEAETYPRHYLLGDANPSPKVFVFCSPASRARLDIDDLKIIKALSKNARASSTSIAHHTGISERIVRYRRKILEKNGVIVGYKLALDYRALDHLFFKCFIKFQGAGEERLHDIKLYARQHPNVVHWLKVIGEWDLELELETSSIEEFYRISNELREKFADIIQTFDAVLVRDEHVITHA